MSAAKVNQPPVKPLIPRKPVYRRRFKLPDGSGEGTAEFHEDKIVIRRRGGRRTYEVPFGRLWQSWTGTML